MLNYDNIVTENYPSGNIWRIIYRLNSQRHRLDGPAYIEYEESGNVFYYLCQESYYINDSIHRLDGPAITSYQQSGMNYERYVVDGKIHRLDGPARIWYNESKQITRTEYYLHDERIRTKKFIDRMELSNNKTKIFLQIMLEEPRIKCVLFDALTRRFKSELDLNVINNMEMFI